MRSQSMDTIAWPAATVCRTSVGVPSSCARAVFISITCRSRGSDYYVNGCAPSRRMSAIAFARIGRFAVAVAVAVAVQRARICRTPPCVRRREIDRVDLSPWADGLRMSRGSFKGDLRIFGRSSSRIARIHVDSGGSCARNASSPGV